MSKKMNVHIVDKGPIKVSNFESIKYCGNALEQKGDAYLCRCGDSSKAPFCDGTHAKVGFSGKNELENQQELRTWEGKTIRTHFNANICMHARYCKPLNDLRKRETEEGDASAAQEIARVVASCPSGALSYEMIGASNSIEFESSSVIEIMEGGEIRVQTEFESDEVRLQEGQPGNRLTLCRCGLSKNKPFCDASHSHKEGFK